MCIAACRCNCYSYYYHHCHCHHWHNHWCWPTTWTTCQIPETQNTPALSVANIPLKPGVTEIKVDVRHSVAKKRSNRW